MNEVVYWYYKDGKLKQHLSPPTDPANTTFATVRLEDIGFKQVQAEVTFCIEGKYSTPKFFKSFQNQLPQDLRNRVETYVKSELKEHRSITDWSTQERKKSKQSIKSKRKCKCK
jgi:hypothetical protein